jgi:uncharacterized protein involved in outer membrane biogenesis
MKLLKISFSILVLLILVCVLAVGCLLYFIDPNKLKPVLMEEVKKGTGYELAIEGKLTWALYPRVAIKMDRMMLTAPNKTIPFIDATDVRIATDLAALLQSHEKLQGNIHIANVRWVNIRAENISANLHWKNNILTLNPIKASFYKGTLEGMAMGSDLMNESQWQWDMQCNNVDIKSLLQDLNGADNKIKISGIGNVKIQAKTQGKNRDKILNELNGVAQFNLSKGIVDGVDINYFLKTADILLSKEEVNLPENIHQTEFDSFTGSVAIKNGVGLTKNLLLQSPTFQTTGEGTIVLNTSDLDLELRVKPLLKNANIRWGIPLLLTGDLKHPDVRLDHMEIQKMLAGLQIDKIKQEAAKQIEKHIHGKTGDFLQRLLSR